MPGPLLLAGRYACQGESFKLLTFLNQRHPPGRGTPTTSDTYLVGVWARVPGSANPYDAWRDAAYVTVTDGPVSAVSHTVNQVLPVAPGTPLTWTAAATGGTAPLEFQFWRYDATAGTWAVVQDWSASRTYSTSACGADSECLANCNSECAARSEACWGIQGQGRYCTYCEFGACTYHEWWIDTTPCGGGEGVCGDILDAWCY